MLKSNFSFVTVEIWGYNSKNKRTRCCYFLWLDLLFYCLPKWRVSACRWRVSGELPLFNTSFGIIMVESILRSTSSFSWILSVVNMFPRFISFRSWNFSNYVPVSLLPTKVVFSGLYDFKCQKFTRIIHNICF